ncbi:MAG: RNA 2',3'-cyclic phosphodiesterase [Hydrogenophilaceae bacterium]|nr:RNA 2',3'-cyclic phosphodiesterase [Hydrogenophilaceae bacterium]
MAEVTATARVFFALWPDETLRQALNQASDLLHQVHGGRRTKPDTLHLTLLFVGSLERDRLPELQAAAAHIQLPRFEVAFDRVDCWRHNRIGFLTASQPPAGLFDLVQALEAQVSEAGIAFDRRPYKPHITLLRNADCKNAVSVQANVDEVEVKRSGRKQKSKPALAPILWAARDFVLVESSLDSNGASYREIARWPLL